MGLLLWFNTPITITIPKVLKPKNSINKCDRVFCIFNTKCLLKCPPVSLFAFNRLKKRFKITGSKTSGTHTLNDLKK